MKKIACLMSMVAGALTATAAVTLTGDETVTALDASGYTAESDVTLTVDLAADTSYSGVVSGPVTVVKKGTGRLTLSGKWTNTGGTKVLDGVIQAPDSSYFCGNGATITLDGGGLAQTTGTTWARKLTVAPRSEGTLDIANGCVVSFNFNMYLTIVNGKLRLTGDGILYGTGRPPADNVRYGRLSVESSTFRSGSVLLSHPEADPFPYALELHEGVTMDVLTNRCITLPLETSLCGATITCSGRQENLGSNLVHIANKTYDGVTLGGLVTALPSATTSVIENFSVALAPSGAETLFDVKEGAVLEVRARLNPGIVKQDGVVQYRTGQGFSKCGKGELVLKGPVGVDGTIVVSEGTLTLSQKAYSGLSATFDVRPGATVRLENGTVLASGVKPADADPLLAQAEVWFDAARIQAADGASIAAVPNLGTCGGAFRRFPERPDGSPALSIPAVPTYAAAAINGHPALAFNGIHALNFASYTNNGNGLTVFCVYKWSSYSDTACCGTSCAPFSMQPIMPDGCHSNDSVSLNADGSVAHYNYGGMVGGLYNGYAATSGGAPARYIAQTGTQRYTLDWSSKVEDRLGPIITVHRRLSNSNSGRVFYGVGSSDVLSSGEIKTVSYNENIQNICLGGRLYVDGAAMCSKNDAPPPYSNDVQNRLFLGHIGEYIVFSRGLSDAERTYVETYLRRKWFDVADAMPTLAGAEAAVSTNLVVEVPAGTKAMLAPGEASSDASSGLVLKTGSGELAYSGANVGAGEVEVAAGALALEPTTSLAAIWIDPSDADTVTLETGADSVTRVTELRNKGAAGGSFRRNPYTYDGFSAFCPPYNASGINGRATLSFDRFSALATDAYTNWNEAVHQQVIYAVLQRNEYSASYTSGPFCLGYRTMANYDANADYNVRWTDASDKSTSAVMSFRNNSVNKTCTVNYPATDGVPFIASVQQCEPLFLFAMWNPASGAHNLKAYEFPDQAPMRVDWVQLGGRLQAGGAAFVRNAALESMNRMWKGEVGEFIVFDRQLSQADEAELIAYLEKKWFNVGSGSATPPACLAGRAAAPAFRAGTALTMGAGTTLASSGPTVELAALTFGAGVTVARRGGDALKIADVAGALTFGGSATLETSILPQDSAQLFTYGSLVPATDWTLPPKYAVVNDRAAQALNLLRAGKLIIIFR